MPTTTPDYPHWFSAARPVPRPATTPADPERLRADRAAPTPPPQPQRPPPPTATTVSGGPGSEPAGAAGSDPATAPRAAGAPRPARTGLTVAVVTVVGAWLLVLVLITRVEVDSGVRDLARFGHLAALAVGFGAVLTVGSPPRTARPAPAPTEAGHPGAALRRGSDPAPSATGAGPPACRGCGPGRRPRARRRGVA